MKKLTAELKQQLFPKNLVLAGYRGSIAHNTYIPNEDPNGIDDIDLMGIYLKEPSYYIGLSFGKDYIQDKFVGHYDVVNYELRKFVKMLLNANPNVVSMLWLKDNLYVHKTLAGELLIENRNMFSSKLSYKTFTGYAYSQLKRMENFTFEGYMGEKRKALVNQFGYDTKNAAHCIRLLRMGMEFLRSGELNVERDDAAMLLRIKKGEWSLEEVKEEAARLFKLADEAYIRSPLPEKPDYEGVEGLLMRILRDYLYN